MDIYIYILIYSRGLHGPYCPICCAILAKQALIIGPWGLLAAQGL
jgi:hypothetical protein